MLLRVVAILACAAFGAAVHCAECAGQIGDYHLNPYAVCYKEGEHHDTVTRCEYAGLSSAVYYCDYNATGEKTNGWSLCPEKVAVADIDNCTACHNFGV